MWSDGFLLPITIRLRMAADLPGSLSSGMRKIVFIALICSDVSRWRCGRTGYWSLWTSILGASSGSEFTLGSLMASTV